MVLLNIRLVESQRINTLYYNYLTSNISIKSVRDKTIIYNKHLPIIIKYTAINNNKIKRISIK